MRECVNCEFVAAMRDVEGRYLECRHNPPATASGGGPSHPRVKPTHWCGAFRCAGNIYERMKAENGC